LFADDQVTVAKSKDVQQISIHKLETVTSKYRLKISTNKKKRKAFKGRDPVRSKTVINNNITKQINTVNYLFRTRMKKNIYCCQNFKISPYNGNY